MRSEKTKLIASIAALLECDLETVQLALDFTRNSSIKRLRDAIKARLERSNT